MSVRVMSAVWGLDLPDSEMLILLALADWSNDEGVCWPSIAQLVKKTRKSERTIQGTIKSLVAKGHMERVEVPGRGCSYTLHPRSDCAPAVTAPRTKRTPAKSAPPQRTAPTPAAAADNTSIHTISSQEASPPSRPVRATKLKPFRLPDDWSPERFAAGTVAREVIDRRGIEWARAALESFRNWAANAKDVDGIGRKIDWQRAWANWVIEQDKRDGTRNGTHGMAGNNGRGAAPARIFSAGAEFVSGAGRGSPH